MLLFTFLRHKDASEALLISSTGSLSLHETFMYIYKYNQMIFGRHYLGFVEGVVSMTSDFKTASSLGYQARIAPIQVVTIFVNATILNNYKLKLN